MIDHYDTRCLPQDLLEAILALWEAPTRTAQRLPASEHAPQLRTGEDLLAQQQNLRHAALLAEGQ